MNKVEKAELCKDLEMARELEHSLSQLLMKHSFLYLPTLNIRRGKEQLENMVKEIDYL
jgi:hypothetical protein